jgi:hypothetical protein
MSKYRDEISITNLLEREWAYSRRQERVESMARVLAYLFRFEGAEHEEPRRKELTAEDWQLEAQIRDEAPGILSELTEDGPETLKRNPGIVPQDEHGLTSRYIGAWLWVSIDRLARKSGWPQ